MLYPLGMKPIDFGENPIILLDLSEENRAKKAFGPYTHSLPTNKGFMAFLEQIRIHFTLIWISVLNLIQNFEVFHDLFAIKSGCWLQKCITKHST